MSHVHGRFGLERETGAKLWKAVVKNLATETRQWQVLEWKLGTMKNELSNSSEFCSNDMDGLEHQGGGEPFIRDAIERGRGPRGMQNKMASKNPPTSDSLAGHPHPPPLSLVSSQDLALLLPAGTWHQTVSPLRTFSPHLPYSPFCLSDSTFPWQCSW